MHETIHVAFCADRRVLPGLHVAAYSVLENHRDPDSLVHLHLLSSDIAEVDIELLRVTLDGSLHPYQLTFHPVTEKDFSEFPSMEGSWGAYFRLLAPKIIYADRIVYIDVDTICYLDVADFYDLDLMGHPGGFVAETTIAKTPDKSLQILFLKHGEKPCFNSGVMVIDIKIWNEKRVTERCFEFLHDLQPLFHDQTALNYVLFEDWKELDSRFNFISNWRKNWPFLGSESDRKGKLIHFLDSPKLWDLGAEFIHPHYHLWQSVLTRTAMRNYRSWDLSSGLRFPKTSKTWIGYKKAIKDRILFEGYSRGLIKNVKGIS